MSPLHASVVKSGHAHLCTPLHASMYLPPTLVCTLWHVRRPLHFFRERDELLTREAISARTAERFRAINDAESEAGTGNAIDRAMRTATIIDTCIKQLSCHTLTVGQGTILLHEQSTQAFA